MLGSASAVMLSDYGSGVTSDPVGSTLQPRAIVHGRRGESLGEDFRNGNRTTGSRSATQAGVCRVGEARDGKASLGVNKEQLDKGAGGEAPASATSARASERAGGVPFTRWASKRRACLRRARRA